MLINCKICNKEKNVRPAHIKMGWGKYCSRKCSGLGAIGRKGYWLGKKFTKEHTKNMTLAHTYKTGKNHPMWKENPSYIAKHQWMNQWYGKPEFCEGCGTQEAIRFEWANISGNYIRDRKDWLRLCPTCHRVYDKVGYKSWDTRRQRYGYSGREVQALR